MTRVLITGVRGKTGQPLAEQLAARAGVEVLGGSADPAAVSIAGVRPVAFSWDDPSTWGPAAAGIDALFLVRPDLEQAPELIEKLLAVIPADARVTLLSELDADSIGEGSWAVRAEDAVRRGGHPWTLLRPSWFMQVFTDRRYYRDELVRDATLTFPANGAEVAWIDTRDIAAVAVRTLLEDGHDGKTYELSGPAALTLPRTAELLSAAVGKTVAHQDISIGEAVGGFSGFEREEFTVTFERIRDGVFAAVTGAVEEVTGGPARSLEQFLADTGPLN
ncbi:NmrA family NAD(P)-binding protein [Amycolatopsis sp. CA-230715]|uniref:NmrA family NAD(P)-binding protein n=1 Tax=Amycolatopsis sp. CA-230715 TaxID=2745196 RepID=UPI001C016915|nr:NAD(P)H-binding protein [Amycolatopsis sp. CA-230715]QWF83809.1 NAD(P)H azoreductase [Amycolatopsis sp. CA-230715]